MIGYILKKPNLQVLWNLIKNMIKWMKLYKKYFIEFQKVQKEWMQLKNYKSQQIIHKKKLRKWKKVILG